MAEMKTSVNGVGERCAHIPTLRVEGADSPSLNPAVYARTTCYQAGHLVTKNAGWRNMRPVIDAEKCTMCLQCYLYCPDGTVYKVRPDGGEPRAVAIDYDFCKGCGICARICKFGAIEMVLESEAIAAEAAEAARVAKVSEAAAGDGAVAGAEGSDLQVAAAGSSAANESEVQA